MTSRLPLPSPRPDSEYLIGFLMGRIPGGRPPLIEYLVDETLMRPILAALGRDWVGWSSDREKLAAHLDNLIAFWYHMGYSFIRFEIPLPFPSRHLVGHDPSPFADQERAWNDQHHGLIETEMDFECYPWPRLEDFDFFPYEYLNTHLPEGMGLIASHAAGPFEHLSALMSYEVLCLALYDTPVLVKAVADRVGGLMEGYYRHLLDLDRLIAVFPGDDMGFRSGTLIGPEHLRSLTLPWHKRFANLTHQRGLPYFLHSCGNLSSIMDSLIDEVGIDGKHSFEDAILPVEAFQLRYGGLEPGRIAVLGGLDLNVLALGTPDEVRRRTCELIDICGARGRYAVGSGNSIPSYIPLENYLAMVDAALTAS